MADYCCFFLSISSALAAEEPLASEPPVQLLGDSRDR